MRDRLRDAVSATSFERERRSYTIWKWTNEGFLDDIAISVTGGSHATRKLFAGYRGAAADGPVALSAPILFRKETSNDRLAKRMKLAVEPQTGHERFDAEVFIQTNAPEAEVKALLSDAAAVDAVSEAMKHFTSILLGDPQGTIAGILTTTDVANLKEDANEARIASLDALAAALPELAASVAPPQSLMPVRLMVWSMGYNLVVAAGIYGWMKSNPLDGWLIVRPILGALLVHGISAATLGRWVVRGRANAVMGFLGITLVGAAEMGVGFVGAANYANQLLDKSKPATLKADVARFKPAEGDNDAELYIKLDGDKDERQIDEDLMPSKDCKRLELTVREGRFKKRWIKTVKCVD